MRRRDFIALASAVAAFPRAALGLQANLPRIVSGPQIATPYRSRTVETRFEPNTPRLRELDFSPFRADLQRFNPERRQQIDAIVRGATIPGVAAALAGGTLTSVELTLYFLGRIQRHDDLLRSSN